MLAEFVGPFDCCSFALSCEALFPLLAEFVGPNSDLICHPSGIHECSSSEIVRNAVVWAGFQWSYLPLQIVQSSCRQWTPDGRNLNIVIALVFGHWTIGLIPEFLLVNRVDFKDIPHGPAVPSKPPHHPLNEELVWSEFTLRGYFMIVPPTPESIEGGVKEREEHVVEAIHFEIVIWVEERMAFEVVKQVVKNTTHGRKEISPEPLNPLVPDGAASQVAPTVAPPPFQHEAGHVHILPAVVSPYSCGQPNSAVAPRNSWATVAARLLGEALMKKHSLENPSIPPWTTIRHRISL